MSIREFTAYQPMCDAEGCDYILNSEYEEWFQDRAAAAEGWEANEQWTDGTVFLCERHVTLPHAHIAVPSEWRAEKPCARCGVWLDEHEVPE